MNCKTTRSWMVEQTDGTLTAPRQAQMAAHLAGCSDCARLAREMAATRALLRALPPRQTSPQFEARLAARVADARRPATGRGWWAGLVPPMPPRLRPALALGAATFAVASALFLHPWVQPPPAPTLADDYSGLISQSVALHVRDVDAQPLAAPATGVAAGHSVWTADSAAQGEL